MANPEYPRYKTPTGSYIVNASRKLFLEKGYDATTLADIAEELGVTKAAIYHWFKAKEQILERVVQPFLEAVDALLEQFRPQAGGVSTKPVELCERFLRLVRDNPDSELFLLDTIQRQPVVKEQITRQGEDLRKLLGPSIDDRKLPAICHAAKLWLVPDSRPYPNDATIAEIAREFVGRERHSRRRAAERSPIAVAARVQAHAR